MSLVRPAAVDELLNYRLARLLAATSAPGIRLLEGRYGIRRRGWSLLGLVAAYGAMSPSELAERSHLERAKVSLNITALVADGLLVRVAMPSDRRRAQVDLTAKGRALFEEVFPQLAALSTTVLEALTPAQVDSLDQIIGVLGAAASALNAQVPIPDKADRRHGGSRRGRAGMPTMGTSPR
ncbi:MAG: MarR family winged helix-turn-helix transcriptional regulator [Caldimonas sp.]